VPCRTGHTNPALGCADIANRCTLSGCLCALNHGESRALCRRLAGIYHQSISPCMPRWSNDACAPRLRRGSVSSQRPGQPGSRWRPRSAQSTPQAMPRHTPALRLVLSAACDQLSKSPRTAGSAVVIECCNATGAVCTSSVQRWTATRKPLAMLWHSGRAYTDQTRSIDMSKCHVMPGQLRVRLTVFHDHATIGDVRHSGCRRVAPAVTAAGI